MSSTSGTEAFIERWRGVTASELSTAQSFVRELCDLLEVPKPHPTPEQDYMFERPVEFQHGDGATSAGQIDCYKRGHFVLEAQKVKAGAHTKGFDDALMRARAQGEGYARALPAAEGRPPFVVVVDVGNVIELYSEFTRSGATYIPFPDPRTHRIKLDDLQNPETRKRLALIWTDPVQLDPAHASAKVTRDVAVRLATVARSLEAAGNAPPRCGRLPYTVPLFHVRRGCGTAPQVSQRRRRFRGIAEAPRERPRDASADDGRAVGGHGSGWLQRRTGQGCPAIQRQTVPPGTVMVDQMYVHYRIPVGAGKTPIVLVHGGGLTGASYETTPDGREGWATYFARKGFPVYVVDTPGRGRAGFDSTAVNRARKEADASGLPPNVLMVTGELAWPLFRFGPTYGTAYSDTQYPVQAMPAFGAQVVPFGEAFYEGSPMQAVPRALAELLDRIGPSVVVVHSLAGPFADALVELRPKLVRAVVNIEGAQNVVPSDKQVAAYSGVPALELFGDHLDAPVFTAGSRLQARQAVVDRINRQPGGIAVLKKLPDAGMKGNSHMMMQDKNNLQVADFILDWLQGALK